MSETEQQSFPLELRGISKRFGAVTAIQRFDLHVAAGEVLALVGDNGAGKSTLVKIISGVYQPTAGEILLHGQPTSLRDPSDAREHGIEVVFQDLALVDLQPVYMNLFLGRELSHGPFQTLDRKSMIRETQELVDDLDVRIPSAKVPLAALSGGQRQAIAIARATHWASSLVLMDEPTAALGVAETAKVEELILRLKSRGAAMLVVSHNMEQVFRIADRVTVLRRGKQVDTRNIADVSQNELVAMITGLSG
ncbi:MAG: ATP-binding cassette domain-containing protein [Bifidobacterium tibiigranuli]|jgi:simple sugar transport system ATP-binding protein|uniref:ATP-binding cassette domain-containing protein n=1 Tax=Bifidobacterium tibiigranuli TaxID=2172043 RepID=UPI0026EECB8D|nr:ATP-binding cassette domain-containing protein [Bifidobacterium tibiigranuli]MCI1674416.1 ATP-binding cassette domain-containing protein [Bifidobacterium tibiigranuli]MCI1713934.1 ATP-binding cassette domain-containing protein [Bifidobacterium tibiigranuli]MCI1834734.1 ATP-binding cassette domain-containing protein [Bifidobacterium tibiigranuli]